MGVGFEAVMYPSRQQRDLGRRYLSLLTSQPMQPQHCCYNILTDRLDIVSDPHPPVLLLIAFFLLFHRPQAIE